MSRAFAVVGALLAVFIASAPAHALAVMVEGEGALASVFLGERGRERGTRVEMTARFRMNPADCTWRRAPDGRFEWTRVRTLVPLERAGGDAKRFAMINATVLTAVVGAPDQRTLTCFRSTLDRIAAGDSPLR
jgi:hypothetical protein